MYQMEAARNLPSYAWSFRWLAIWSEQKNDHKTKEEKKIKWKCDSGFENNTYFIKLSWCHLKFPT